MKHKNTAELKSSRAQELKAQSSELRVARRNLVIERRMRSAGSCSERRPCIYAFFRNARRLCVRFMRDYAYRQFSVMIAMYHDKIVRLERRAPGDGGYS